MFPPMKIIDRIDPIVKARQNYDIITKECQVFLQTLQNFQITLSELLDLPLPKVKTVKGTSLDLMVKEHLNALLQISIAFRNFSVSLQDDSKKFQINFELRQNHRDVIDNEIKVLNDDILNLLDKKSEGNIIKLRDQLKKKASDLKAMANNRNREEATENLKKAYPIYMEDLNFYKSRLAKLNSMITKLQSLIKDYFILLTTTDMSYRTQLVSDGLRSIAIHLNGFGENLEKSVSGLQTRQLEFDRDFTLYAEKLRIEFTDVDYNQFIQCPTVKKPGAKLPLSSDVTTFPYNIRRLPEYIARLKANFEGKNSNELTARKGQKVGILIEKDVFKGWTMCMNLCYINQKGYIPTEYLEKVGKGMCVLKTDLNVNGFYGFKGSLLSYIEKEGDDKLICEDYAGNQTAIPIENLIVFPTNSKSDSILGNSLAHDDQEEKNLPLRGYLTFDSSLYKDINDFEEEGKIGSGNYSEVKLYKHKKTGELLAFKIIEVFVKSDSAEAQRSYLELRREIVIATLFYVPTLHTLYGIIDDKENSRFIIITPYYKEGDLASMIKKENDRLSPQQWDFTQKYIVMYGIASGMYILHHENLIHRDLKPGNILLNDELEPMITDFGLSKLVDQNNSMHQTQAAGTPAFVSPEIFEFLRNEDEIVYDGKMADVYAFAVLCYQLFTLHTPFEDIKSQYELVTFVIGGGRPKFPDNFNKQLKNFIEKCWHKEPQERPSFEAILETIGSKEFISNVGGIDIKRLHEYQDKAAPDLKFNYFTNIENEEEELNDDSIKEMPNPFQVESSLIKEVSDYRKVEPIGKGRFGLVFKCQDIETDEFVAIKRIGSRFDEKQLQREIWILSTFHHPTLLSLRGVIQDEYNDSFNIVTAFYSKGDLLSMIKSENEHHSPIEWNHTKKFIVLYGIAAGMYFLHKYNIIHRDLKPNNILLNDDLEPIITDFGLSKVIDQNNTLFQTSAFGTPVFMAPEIITSKTENGGIYYDGKKADVYAFALICYQLYSGISPFKSANNQFQLARILAKGERPSIPDGFNESIRSLIECCWSQNPVDRPPFETIIEQLGSREFIEGVGSIDIDGFIEYQKKVVPKKFRLVQPQKKEEEEVKKKLVRRDTWRRPVAAIVKEMADAGDKESMYNYACLLRDGKDVQKNEQEAVFYFKKSASLGYIHSAISYAMMLKEGIGCQKDEKEAFKVMESAANMDDSEAQYKLGLWCANSVPPQFATASVWLKKAADNDRPDPEAPATYASLLERGKLGFIPPMEEIMKYYKKSSDLGSPKGMYHMALLYHSGEYIGLEKDVKEAIRLYEIASSQGSLDASLSLSYAYEEVGMLDEAFNNATFYADKDYFIGFLRLFELYQKGVGVSKDSQRSNEYLVIASDKRFAKAQSHVSSLFSKGKGVPFDPQKAFFWAEKAALNGSPEGATSLADYFFDGFGCPEKDINKALEWAKKGADGGDVSALRLLAKIYANLKDDQNEFKYLKLAAESGNEKAMLKIADYYMKNSNYDESMHWFKILADNMNPVGCFSYGDELFNGEHVTKDVKKGLEYLKLAADLNNIKAIEKLAIIYNDGTPDVPKDEEKSLQYSQKLKYLETLNAEKKKSKKKTKSTK